MEGLDFALVFEPDALAASLDHCASGCDKQAFDRSPWERSRYRVCENSFEGLALLAVHRGIIGLLSFIASTRPHLAGTAFR